ncbi:retrovirus-related pol polyprotein from transposon TNT 1-94 [Tanacetum coccineum]
MITIHLWLHPQVMQLSNMSTLWDTLYAQEHVCNVRKTAGHDRPRHLVLQILWGIIHRSNIDYVERIWEEFVQSIQTFLTDKKRLTMALRGKKKSTPLLILSIRLTKLIIHHLKTKHNIYPRTGSPLHYSYEDNILGTLGYVGKDGREVFERDMAEEEAVPESPKATKVTQPKAAMQTKPSAPKATKVIKPASDKAPKPTFSQPPKPTPTLIKSSKEIQGVPDKEPAYNDEEANRQQAMELSLKEQEE